jgi:predicted acyl esterase
MNVNVAAPQTAEMQIDWDVPIAMDDGIVLRADVFRPVQPGKYPVLMSYGPYGKGLHFEDGYKTAWDLMARDYPETVANTSNRYQSWEVADPEKWVPHGFVIVRVDSRGAGRSPGFSDHHSEREHKDFHDCIEWAAGEPWSNGKIGLCGISFYATSQWKVAGKQPPHLAAICVWEGWGDRYRDSIRHGGILSTYQKDWLDLQINTVQHGVGERGKRSRVTGELVCGPETLPKEELAKNRADLWPELMAHEFDGDYYKERSAHWDKITVPLLSCGNWGGNGLHLRGNVEGFVRAASKHKWLEMHGGTHWAVFYTDWANELQRRFFDYFLKGEKNGWEKHPAVQLQVRHPGEKFVTRYENEWPIARTQWTKVFLDPVGRALTCEPPKSESTLSFEALGDGILFWSEPMPHETEITGPLAAKLFVSSSTADADLFLVVRVFDPAGKEVTFQGAVDPHTPIAQGWLRASHRKLDPKLSLPYRPYHPHEEKEPLTPGEVYELDIEIWPTCIVIPTGYRLALHVRGKDYEYEGAGERLNTIKRPMKGCAGFVHDEPSDRPESIFGGATTLHFGPERQPYLLAPMIPEKK